MLVGKIAFMLGLEVAAPEYGVFKFTSAALENLYRLCVINACKFAVYHMLQFVEQALLNKLIAELHFLRAVFKGLANDELYEFLSDIHYLMNVGKADLRLHMPEFRDMPWRVAFFCAE